MANNIFHTDNLKETMTVLVKRYDELHNAAEEFDYDTPQAVAIEICEEQDMITAVFKAFVVNKGKGVCAYYGLPQPE